MPRFSLVGLKRLPPPCNARELKSSKLILSPSATTELCTSIIFFVIDPDALAGVGVSGLGANRLKNQNLLGGTSVGGFKSSNVERNLLPGSSRSKFPVFVVIEIVNKSGPQSCTTNRVGEAVCTFCVIRG